MKGGEKVMQNKTCWGGGIPLGVPDNFLEVFFKWKSDVRSIMYGASVRKAAKKLSIDELMNLLHSHQWPNLNPEMYKFAILELSCRQLTPEQKSTVKELWNPVKNIANNIDVDIQFNLKENLKIKEMLQ